MAAKLRELNIDPVKRTVRNRIYTDKTHLRGFQNLNRLRQREGYTNVGATRTPFALALV
ncbi:hypothetical protein [Nostoc sp. UHCC 0251]|uniref:hypothetical protein n=1 Tax=Nostoc sp. UHCC 0251 TaxID=3110240 RepID=UPI002B21F028|nr:hypothetical protein [Nostoc sp. UHCC 0251]MEA5626654.1 hypothetical protein [Nostoc sp. UHCC 0251]